MVGASRGAGPEVIQEARALAGRGEVHDAIALLSDANRVQRDAAIECELVRIRHEGFDHLSLARPALAPQSVQASTTRRDGLPSIAPSQLSVESIREGLAEHGCLHVRGLVPSPRVASLVDGIDRAFAAFDEAEGDGGDVDPGWYTPFVPKPGEYRVAGRRKWLRAGGALWTADCPHMLFELTALIDSLGVGEVFTDLLGERPALSANKCTLRRAAVDSGGGWHQDGAFLGEEIRAINLWIALTDCGVDAPTMDIVPARLDHIVPTGTDGAAFDWSVGDGAVERAAGSVGILRPTFAAGDVLIFDHLFLHRTAAEPWMTHERHAIETWFFAPSTYPKGQIPLVY